MKKRICELLTGDVFLIWGVWRKVSKIENGRLYFCWLNEQKCRESFGARSQQFVIVESVAVISKSERKAA